VAASRHPDTERGQGKKVDPDVVVFEMRARLMQLAVGMISGRGSFWAVRPVGNSPEGSRPVARLAKHVIPGDLCIVLRFE
jgi:hypothetical protein